MATWSIYLTADGVKTLAQSQSFLKFSEALTALERTTIEHTTELVRDIRKEWGCDTLAQLAEVLGVPKVTGKNFGWVIDQA